MKTYDSMIEKIPPHDADAEFATVGSAIQDTVAMRTVQSMGLMPSDCYSDLNQRILKAAYDLAAQGKPTTFIMLKDVLGSTGAKGAELVNYLVDVCFSAEIPAFAKHYCGIVIGHARRRAAIKAMANALEDCFDDGSGDPIDRARAAVAAMAAINASQEDSHTIDFFEAVESVHVASKRAFLTGIAGIDALSWFEAGDYVIIGARPSDGKTALALQMMLNICNSGGRVLFQSLEMNRRAIAHRYLAMKTQIDGRRLRDGTLTADEKSRMHTATSDAGDINFRIDDRAGLTVAAIGANLRKEMLNGPITACFTDHLLKVAPADTRAMRHAQMTQISNDFTRLGRDTGVTMVCLYQLSRGVAKEERDPRLSDLRESGSIEEDADHALLLHRPDHMKSFSDAKVIIAKNRNGPCGSVPLTFNAAQTTFETPHPF